jgi:hypothetical protein
MAFQFGTVFTQAMQNAIAAEQQKKKDIMDYNMNVDKLNLDKWSSYNNLNLDAQRLNEEGKRWGEEMRLKVDDTNWQRQFETQKWNTGLSLEKAKNFFKPTEQWQKNHYDAFGTPWSGVTAPGTDGMVSINAYGEIERPIAEISFKGKQADLDRALSKYITDAQIASNQSIAKLDRDLRLQLNELGAKEDRDKATTEFNRNLSQRQMVLIGPKGDIIKTVYPESMEQLRAYAAQNFVFLSDWNNTKYNSLNGIPDPVKKIEFKGIGGEPY